MLSSAPRAMVNCGRGWGKSAALALTLILLGFDPRNAGLVGVLYVPTYRQGVRIFEEEFLRLLANFQASTGRVLGEWSSAYKVLTLCNGTRICVMSYDRFDRNAGYTFAFGGIDEITTVRREREATKVLLPTIRGRGTLQVRFANTPRGNKGIVKDFVTQVKAGNPRWHFIHGTSYDNPINPTENIEDWKASMSARAVKEEIYACILDSGRRVYDEWNADRHLMEWEFDPSLPYELWIDWGDSHPAILVVQRVQVPWTRVVHGVSTQEVRTVRVACWQFVEDGIAEHRLKQVIKRKVAELGRPPVAAAADRTKPKLNGWLSEEFPACDVHKMVKTEDQEIWNGVQCVKTCLDPSDGGPPSFMVARSLAGERSPRSLVPAFENYIREESNGEMLDYPFKDNITDHIMDCVRMGLMAASQPEAEVVQYGNVGSSQTRSRWAGGRGGYR